MGMFLYGGILRLGHGKIIFIGQQVRTFIIQWHSLGLMLRKAMDGLLLECFE